MLQTRERIIWWNITMMITVIRREKIKVKETWEGGGQRYSVARKGSMSLRMFGSGIG
jgi:hypothetical protein